MGTASAGSRTSILVLSVLTLLFVAVASWMVGRLGDTATPAHAEEPEARSEAVALDVRRSDPAPFVGVAFPEELLADLVREVRLLREEIAGLRESESTRTPVSVDRSTEVKQFERLIARLEAAAASTNTTRERLNLPSIERRTQELSNFDQTLREARDLDQEDELARRFFFWSQQDVLDRFGIPDRIYSTDAGLAQWTYDFEDGDIKYDFTLQFHEGRVIRMW